MARGLTVKANPGKEKMTGGLSLNQLSEQIRELRAKVPVITSPENIPTGEPFVSLFPIQQRNLESIMESIGQNGFDPRKALIVGIFPDGTSFLVDGHTRLSAVKALGLEEVPMWHQTFDSVDDAVDWALHEQIDRRNLSESELYDYVLKVDQMKSRGRGDSAYKGKSSERTADIVGTSPRKVEQIRTVERDASEQQKEAIRSGDKSVNQTYREIKGKDKAQHCANSREPERNWVVKTYIGKVSLIRNGEEVVLVNYTTMETLYGAPAEKLRKVVEQYLEKIL